MNWKKALSLTLRFGLVAAILYFAYTSISMNPHEIWQYLIHTGVLFYASLLLFTLFLAIQAGIWLQILNDGGRQLSLRKGLLIYINSQFAKYIPGGFWNYAGRVVLARREGVNMNVQMAAIFYENVLLVMAAAIYSLFLLIYLHVLHYYVLFLFLIGFGLCYFYFDTVSRWAKSGTRWMVGRFKFLSRFKKPGSNMFIPLSRKSFFLYLLYFLISHLIMGIAFWMLIKTFHIQNINILYAAGTFASAWLLGLLSPLPGGIGVREGFLVYFLSFRMDAATALQISIIARIWNILSEVLFFAIMNVFELTRRRIKQYET